MVLFLSSFFAYLSRSSSTGRHFVYHLLERRSIWFVHRHGNWVCHLGDLVQFYRVHKRLEKVCPAGPYEIRVRGVQLKSDCPYICDPGVHVSQFTTTTTMLNTQSKWLLLLHCFITFLLRSPEDTMRLLSDWMTLNQLQAIIGRETAGVLSRINERHSSVPLDFYSTNRKH